MGFFLFSSCRYTISPLIPEVRSGHFSTRLNSEGLQLKDSQLSLSVGVDSQEGFLTVIWFEGEKETFRDSQYMDHRESKVTFTHPYVTGRDYRAVLVFDKTVLRQFEYRSEPILKPE